MVKGVAVTTNSEGVCVSVCVLNLNYGEKGVICCNFQAFHFRLNAVLVALRVDSPKSNCQLKCKTLYFPPITLFLNSKLFLKQQLEFLI